MNAGMDGINYVIIGVGINVNQESFPEDLADKATSLYLCRDGKRDLLSEHTFTETDSVVSLEDSPSYRGKEDKQPPSTAQQAHCEKLPTAILIEAILEQFERDYEVFQKMGNLSFLLEEYNQLLVNRNQEVIIHQPEGSYQAYALGINSGGELLVRRADGREEAIFAGEVSVRGIEGYI